MLHHLEMVEQLHLSVELMELIRTEKDTLTLMIGTTVAGQQLL